MASIFMSYSTEDRHAADTIQEALIDAKIPTYALAHEQRSLRRNADDVANADTVILLWSRNAAKSPFLKTEISLAIKAWAHEQLILVRLDETELPTGLRDIDSVNLAEGHESGIDQVVSLAKRKVPGADSPVAAARASSEPTRTISPVPVNATVLIPSVEPPAPQHARVWSWKGIVFGIGAALLVAGALLFFNRLSPEIFQAPISASLPTPTSNRIEPSALALIVITAGAVLFAIRVFAAKRSKLRSAAPAAPAPSRPAPAAPAPETLFVFVSYSRLDSGVVDSLVETIEGSGAHVLIDRRQQAVRHRYARSIVEAIKASQHVAVMCSRNSYESDHVIREIYLAGDFKKPFIAFELDGSAIPDELLYFLSGFPRLPAHKMEPENLRAEIARVLA